MIRCLLILVLAYAIDFSFAQLRNALSLYVVLKQILNVAISSTKGTALLVVHRFCTYMYLKVKGFTQLSFLVAKVLVSICV